jgi:hypothetical protein
MTDQKERSCKNCGKKPLAHSAKYMLCPGSSENQYEPDPNAEGRIPSTKPQPYRS